MEQECLGLRKLFEERPDDDPQRRLIELMQRQPLAKDPARGQPGSHGGEMFPRVEKARPILPGVEQVSHNDIIPIRRGSDEPPRVRNSQMQPGPAGRDFTGSCVLRVEERQRLQDFGHQFHAVHFQPGVRSRRAESDPGPRSKEERLPRTRAKENGQVRLPTLGHGRGGATHL